MKSLKDERMWGYLTKVQYAKTWYKSFVLKQIPKGQNAHANSLPMLATSLELKLPQIVIVEDIVNSSLTREPMVRVHSIQVGPSWINPIVAFWK